MWRQQRHLLPSRRQLTTRAANAALSKFLSVRNVHLESASSQGEAVFAWKTQAVRDKSDKRCLQLGLLENRSGQGETVFAIRFGKELLRFAGGRRLKISTFLGAQCGKHIPKNCIGTLQRSFGEFSYKAADTEKPAGNSGFRCVGYEAPQEPSTLCAPVD